MIFDMMYRVILWGKGGANKICLEVEVDLGGACVCVCVCDKLVSLVFSSLLDTGSAPDFG